ncbi:MAG TPA: hypothetical protein VFN49_02360 [Candidatus Aquilonibacter sp.]|nr:hypothetical protein [Candidatus Aquilonibacter sp.]
MGLWKGLAALVASVAIAGIAMPGSAQEATPAASPTPRVQIAIAPYIWLPTLRSNVQYTIPQLPNGTTPGGGTSFVDNVQVGPGDYLSKVNSAGMLAFEVRSSDLELIGDYIFMNLNSNATIASTLPGPLGGQVPVSFATNSHFSSSIWELAAGVTFVRGRSGDASVFIGTRHAPLKANLDYTATIGASGALSRSGSTRVSQATDDVIFGFNGSVVIGNHWFVPYYIDMGSGANQQTWQGYIGVGYGFQHGQRLIATYRTLNYYGFPADAPITKFVMSGPMLGYKFSL